MLLPISGSGKRAAKETVKEAPKKAAKPVRAPARSRKAAPGPKDPKRTGNPLTHIRFGSAGSGGAEFDPISGSSKKRAR